MLNIYTDTYKYTLEPKEWDTRGEYVHSIAGITRNNSLGRRFTGGGCGFVSIFPGTHRTVTSHRRVSAHAKSQYIISYTVAFLSPEPVTMYLSSVEMSQESTEEVSFDWKMEAP